MSSFIDNGRAASDGGKYDRPTFIDSHRARSACGRELARLREEVARRVTMLSGNEEMEAVVRSSPDRYIVQLGPVALSVAWLRSRFDTVSDGELLVIVWQGTVARRAAPLPEKPREKASTTATVLWEEIVSAAAENEESWRWRPSAEKTLGFTSDELAERCVDQLRRAYRRCAAA